MGPEVVTFLTRRNPEVSFLVSTSIPISRAYIVPPEIPYSTAKNNGIAFAFYLVISVCDNLPLYALSLDYLISTNSAVNLNVIFASLRYKNETYRSSQAAANMKRLLGFVNDLRMRYKLATDLNFRDLGTSILEGDGGAFLRDVMVP